MGRQIERIHGNKTVKDGEKNRENQIRVSNFFKRDIFIASPYFEA